MIDRNLINWFPGNTVPDIKYAKMHKWDWRDKRLSVMCLVVTNLNKTPHIQYFRKYGGLDERNFLKYQNSIDSQNEFWTWDCELYNDFEDKDDSEKEWVLSWAYIGTLDESVVLKEKNVPSVLGDKKDIIYGYYKCKEVGQ